VLKSALSRLAAVSKLLPRICTQTKLLVLTINVFFTRRQTQKQKKQDTDTYSYTRTNYVFLRVNAHLAKTPAEMSVFLLYFFFTKPIFIYLSSFIAHYPRVSSKRFTFTLTLLAMLPG
jgi:hypothetical protein